MSLKINGIEPTEINVVKNGVTTKLDVVEVKQNNTITFVWFRQLDNPIIISAIYWVDSGGYPLNSIDVTIRNTDTRAVDCFIMAYDYDDVARNSAAVSIGAGETITYSMDIDSMDDEGSDIEWDGGQVGVYFEYEDDYGNVLTTDDVYKSLTKQTKVYGKLSAPTSVYAEWRDGDRDDYFVVLHITNPNSVAVTAVWSCDGIQKEGEFTVPANRTNYSYTIAIQETTQGEGELDGRVYFSASGYTNSDTVYFD